MCDIEPASRRATITGGRPHLDQLSILHRPSVFDRRKKAPRLGGAQVHGHQQSLGQVPGPPQELHRFDLAGFADQELERRVILGGDTLSVAQLEAAGMQRQAE